MQADKIERRRELRFPVGARVLVRVQNGQSFTATAVNVSASGALLEFERPLSLQVGEEVILEVDLPEGMSKSLPTWGVARIVHVDSHRCGVQLTAGTFVPDDESREIANTA